MENIQCRLCREHGCLATAQSALDFVGFWVVRRYKENSSWSLWLDLAVREESSASRGCFVLDLFFAEPIQRNLVGCFSGRLLLAMNFDDRSILQRKWKLFRDHKHQNIIVQLTHKIVISPLLLWLLVRKKKRRIRSQFFFYNFSSSKIWRLLLANTARALRRIAFSRRSDCGERVYSSNISFASSSGAWFFAQKRARNESDTRVTGDKAQGTMGRRKKRSACFLLPAFLCWQIFISGDRRRRLSTRQISWSVSFVL